MWSLHELTAPRSRRAFAGCGLYSLRLQFGHDRYWVRYGRAGLFRSHLCRSPQGSELAGRWRPPYFFRRISM
jgi:hypothetical protein